MDEPPNESDETPIQRALRLKKAALASRPKHPGSSKGAQNTKAMPSGASKPWMKR